MLRREGHQSLPALHVRLEPARSMPCLYAYRLRSYPSLRAVQHPVRVVHQLRPLQQVSPVHMNICRYQSVQWSRSTLVSPEKKQFATHVAPNAQPPLTAASTASHASSARFCCTSRSTSRASPVSEAGNGVVNPAARTGGKFKMRFRLDPAGDEMGESNGAVKCRLIWHPLQPGGKLQVGLQPRPTCRSVASGPAMPVDLQPTLMICPPGVPAARLQEQPRGSAIL